MSTSAVKMLPKLNDEQIARFWACVPVSDGDGCWEWTGPVQNGRPLFYVGGEQYRVYAYRVAFMLQYERDPFPHIILHDCDNPRCVRPNHLSLADHNANVQDKISKGRDMLGSVHCHCSLTADQIVAIRESTDIQPVIAERYGVTPELICLIKRGKIYKEAGGPLNVRSQDGVQYYRLRGDEALIREIRLDPDSLQKIAEKHGVSKKAILNIKKGRNYGQFAWTDAEREACQPKKVGRRPKAPE